MIILPRQARDKHRESTQKRTRFCRLPWQLNGFINTQAPLLVNLALGGPGSGVFFHRHDAALNAVRTSVCPSVHAYCLRTAVRHLAMAALVSSLEWSQHTSTSKSCMRCCRSIRAHSVNVIMLCRCFMGQSAGCSTLTCPHHRLGLALTRNTTRFVRSFAAVACCCVEHRAFCTLSSMLSCAWWICVLVLQRARSVLATRGVLTMT
jgi:hypothetical protein